MFCSPTRARSRWSWPAATGPPTCATRRSRLACGRGAHPRSGSFEVFSPGWLRDGPGSPSIDAAAQAALRQRRRRRPRTSRWPRSRTPTAASEIIHLAETGLCADGEQDEASRRRGHGRGRPAAGQHRRRLPGQRRADRRVRPAPGPRGRPPAAGPRARPSGARDSPRVGFTHVYGAPGHQRVHGADWLTGDPTQSDARRDPTRWTEEVLAWLRTPVDLCCAMTLPPRHDQA